MKPLEEQLNDLIAQSDRVAAELSHEVYLLGRADAAITYLRAVREQTALQVAALLEQRAISAISAPSATSHMVNGPNGFGTYDPNWPH